MGRFRSFTRMGLSSSRMHDDAWDKWLCLLVRVSHPPQAARAGGGGGGGVLFNASAARWTNKRTQGTGQLMVAPGASGLATTPPPRAGTLGAKPSHAVAVSPISKRTRATGQPSILIPIDTSSRKAGSGIWAERPVWLLMMRCPCRSMFIDPLI